MVEHFATFNYGTPCLVKGEGLALRFIFRNKLRSRFWRLKVSAPVAMVLAPLIAGLGWHEIRIHPASRIPPGQSQR